MKQLFFRRLVVLMSSLLLANHIYGTTEEKIENGNYELVEKPNIPYYPQDHKNQSDLTQLNLVIPKGKPNPPVLLWIGGELGPM